jgi:hypothetical protein
LNISAFTKLAAASVVLAFLAVLIFPGTFSSLVYAEEPPPITFILQDPSQQNIFQVGEELMYNVSYAFFDLGSVKIQVLDTVTKSGVKLYKAKAYIDSYSGVPFVNLHYVFYSEISPNFYTTFFSSHNTADPKKMEYLQYVFDYPNKKVRYTLGVNPTNEVVKEGVEPITEFQQDGLSLFFFARNNVREKKKITTPVFLNEKSSSTDFNFMNKVISQEIDAVEYPIETVEFEGNAKFTGIFGMTGYFRGFFSNDEAAVPIVAKMKVLLGSIHIELSQWKRPGWIPPKAKK